jgi:methylated-DNA-[protein]-cysteine S-methyltransferase
LSYKEVARLSGRSKAWRAVGNILNKNRNPKIPCHRVIRSNNEIGGYRHGINKKTSLLKKEGVVIKNRKASVLKRRKNEKGSVEEVSKLSGLH